MTLSLQRLMGLEGLTRWVRVAALGKQRAWNDHLEKTGLNTPALVQAYRLFYPGIEMNIGAWEDLREKGQLIAFNHSFLLDLGRDVIAGRIWCSTDGKERDKYPLIVCIQCHRVPLEWIMAEVLPCLDQIGAALAAMSYVDEVVTHLKDFDRQLNQRLRLDRPEPRSCRTYADALAQLARLPELSREGTELIRTLYYLSERDLLASSHEPFHVRLPVSKATASRSVAGWLHLLRAKYGEKVRLTAFWPNDRDWLDLFVAGLPPEGLCCIRATPAAAALTTSIPYAIDPGFRARFEKVLQRAVSGVGHPRG